MKYKYAVINPYNPNVKWVPCERVPSRYQIAQLINCDRPDCIASSRFDDCYVFCVCGSNIPNVKFNTTFERLKAINKIGTGLYGNVVVIAESDNMKVEKQLITVRYKGTKYTAIITEE